MSEIKIDLDTYDLNVSDNDKIVVKKKMKVNVNDDVYTEIGDRWDVISANKNMFTNIKRENAKMDENGWYKSKHEHGWYSNNIIAEYFDKVD